jgi:hypothetical protein
MKIKQLVFLASGFLVMLTLLACTCSGLGPLSSLLATPTSTPTLTPTPSPTPLPTPTSLSVVNASPGTVTQQLGDGSIRFRDLEHGYTLVLPPSWVILPYSQAELQAMVNELAATDPQLAEMAQMMQYSDPNLTRLIALDTNPAHFSGRTAANLNIGADRSSAHVPLSVLLNQVTTALPQALPGVIILETGFSQLSSGQETAFIELMMDISTASGTVTVFEKMTMFQTNSATIMVTLACSPDFREPVLDEFDVIIASVEVGNR